MHLFYDSLGNLGPVPEIVTGYKGAVLSGFHNCVGRLFPHAVNALEGGHDLAVHNGAEPGLGCINVDRDKLKSAGIHFTDDQAVVQCCLLLGCQSVLSALIILHDSQQMISALAHDLIRECRGTDAVVGSIIGKGIMDLAVGDAQSHHDIGCRMGAGEHIFDLQAGIDIPLGHICGLHGILHLRCKSFAFSNRLHGLKRKGLVHSLGNQVGHDVVTGTDRRGQNRFSFLDQGLGVAKPHIRAVGQTGNTDQFRHGRRPCVIEHADDELSAKLRDTQRADIDASVLLCCDSQ